MTAQGLGSCDEFEKTNIHIEGAVSLMKKLEEYVKSIPDFPEKGIIFRDVTSVFAGCGGTSLGHRPDAGEVGRC